MIQYKPAEGRTQEALLYGAGRHAVEAKLNRPAPLSEVAVARPGRGLEPVPHCLMLAAGYWQGIQVGYGKGARDAARLVIEMRQGGYAIDEPWDRGDI